MKILALRFKNLNSLYGEWAIDFTCPEYASNGIFALTGPTGSGKSTILDAICLALYGATPRLGKITKTNNEIMSRLTGECYAEVIFESQAGRFQCHWSQHRARKKAQGNLAEAKHEIADALGGQILETKKREVAGLIEEKTGMDFDRFTRSILLAQGGFDTFLKADQEQKSKILEQITGTEIYTEISRRIHERQRAEREKMNLLQAETSGIVLLSDEQEQAIRTQLAEKQTLETQTAARAREIGQAIVWLTGIKGLQEELSSLSVETEQLKARVEAFKPEQERLGRALKAAELEGAHAGLISVRKQQTEDLKTLTQEETRLPEQEKALRRKQEQLDHAEQAIAQAKAAQKRLAPLIQKVRALDHQLGERKKSMAAGEMDVQKTAEQIAGHKRLLKQTKTRLEASQKELKAVQNYFQSHGSDEILVTHLAGIKEQLNHLASVHKEILEQQQVLAAAEKLVGSASKKRVAHGDRSTRQKQELEKIQTEAGLVKKKLSKLLGDHLLREYRGEKETLLREMVFLKKIADLESHRSKLEDDRPCPLCGSKAHPYAQGNVPKASETDKKINHLTELIHTAEQLELQMKELEAMEKEAASKVSLAEKLETESAHEVKAARKALADILGEIGKNKEQVIKLKQIAQKSLSPLGIQEIPDADVKSLVSALQDRLNLWQASQQKKETIEKQIHEVKGENQKIQAIVQTLEPSLDEKQRAVDAMKKEYEAQVLERRNLFETQNPDTEEAGLEKAVSHAEGMEKRVRKERDGVRQLLHSAQIGIASLKERISKRGSALQAMETGFVALLNSAGFEGESDFLTHGLPATQRNRLMAQAKELDRKETDLAARKKDRETRLALEIQKKITQSTLQELDPVGRELEEALKQVRDQMAGLKHQLTANIQAREKIQEKQLLMDEQKKECSRWEKLHGLIGSADGKKYRNFAQGLTFELMVSHANHQLEKMTDRYLLIRDGAQPLELNVVDNYQAGEIRSTRNLSGGESFIVSLTLALGLSKMASRKVRVDSLFLDEGFGTLDEDALETALETLAGMHQDGKLIGIISHVGALKERISTQIKIQPLSGGRSIIKGPGCRKLVKTE